MIRALLILLLSGCANQVPIADRGTVLLTWEIGYVPGNHCGIAQEIAQGHWLITFKRKPDFNSVCLPHEILHAFGGVHQ